MSTELQMVSELLAEEMAERAREREEFDQAIEAIRNAPKPELDAIIVALSTLTAEVRTLQPPVQDNTRDILARIEKAVAGIKAPRSTNEITFDIVQDEFGNPKRIIATRAE